MFYLGWGVNGEVWKWCMRLMAWEENQVRKCSDLAIYTILQVGVNDKWIWHLNPSKKYFVSSAYHFLSSTNHDAQTCCSDILWNKAVPMKNNLIRRGLFRIMTRGAWEVVAWMRMLFICSFVVVFFFFLKNYSLLSLVRMCHNKSMLYNITFCSFYFSRKFL